MLVLGNMIEPDREPRFIEVLPFRSDDPPSPKMNPTTNAADDLRRSGPPVDFCFMDDLRTAESVELLPRKGWGVWARASVVMCAYVRAKVGASARNNGDSGGIRDAETVGLTTHLAY